MSFGRVLWNQIVYPVARVGVAVTCDVLAIMGCNCTRERLDFEGRRFYVLRRLGEGGFSVVDLLEDNDTGKKFALKRIQCHSREDERLAKEEAEYHPKVNHPNLIPLEAWKVTRGTGGVTEVLIVLPFFRRGTLQDELDRLATKGEFISEHRLLRLFRGMCDGVRALHQASPVPLAHRDIKPGNVLLSDNGTPVIMDFGSMAPARLEVKGRSQALAVQDLAAEKCSMLFRAPELFHVESHTIIDEKVDVWSLGCLLYAMAFLQSPFEPVYQRGDSLHLAVLGRNFKFPDTTRYSSSLKELVSSIIVVEVIERPSVAWIVEQVDIMLQEMEHKV
ncbi:serine/threonine-protein kinase 16-like [Asterias rubens]|uniref:serine/threonine-protein kinase 16-like n=1 Tax=Asterias rubens TaxID=7604 RepID=UPI00145537D3|nr:serine/threonine-protein kinase 16-like [Asterias rubens]